MRYCHGLRHDYRKRNCLRRTWQLHSHRELWHGHWLSCRCWMWDYLGIRYIHWRRFLYELRWVDDIFSILRAARLLSERGSRDRDCHRVRDDHWRRQRHRCGWSCWATARWCRVWCFHRLWPGYRNWYCYWLWHSIRIWYRCWIWNSEWDRDFLWLGHCSWFGDYHRGRNCAAGRIDPSGELWYHHWLWDRNRSRNTLWSWEIRWQRHLRWLAWHFYWHGDGIDFGC